MRLKVKAEFFYVEVGMVASTNTGWLHTTFDMLTGLFKQVGLKKNVKKTVRVVCHPCQAVGVRSDKAYTRQTKGAGGSYRERQREQINCLGCGTDL